MLADSIRSSPYSCEVLRNVFRLCFSDHMSVCYLSFLFSSFGILLTKVNPLCMYQPMMFMVAVKGVHVHLSQNESSMKNHFEQ